MAQIKDNIPKAMGKLMREQEKHGIFPPDEDYIKMMKELYDSQTGDTLDKLVEQLVNQGHIKVND